MRYSKTIQEMLPHQKSITDLQTKFMEEARRKKELQDIRVDEERRRVKAKEAIREYEKHKKSQGRDSEGR